MTMTIREQALYDAEKKLKEAKTKEEKDMYKEHISYWKKKILDKKTKKD